MENAVDFYESGIGQLARESNSNPNLSFSPEQLEAFSRIPNFKESIFEELEVDWKQSSKSKAKNVVFRYMNELRTMLHRKRESNIDINEAFRISMIVTLR